MPKYKLHADMFLKQPSSVSAAGGVLHPAGSIVEYDGKPSWTMEPMDDEAWEVWHADPPAPIDPKRIGQGPVEYPFQIKPRSEGGSYTAHGRN